MDKWLSLIDKCEYRKSASEAEVYRKKGNNYYMHKDSWKALEFYSKVLPFIFSRIYSISLYEL